MKQRKEVKNTKGLPPSSRALVPAAAGASRALRNIMRSRRGVRAALRGSTAGAVVRATALGGVLALDANATVDGVVDDVRAEEEGLANDPLVTSVDWWRGDLKE